MIIKDGREYARVSDILKRFNDFSHIDPGVLANKCRIGTEVHEAIAKDIEGDFPVLHEDSWGYFKSYLLWSERMECNYVQSEQRYYNDAYMITGQIDALIKTNSKDLPILVDFKTSAAEGETWQMQAHLYSNLLDHNLVEHQRRYLFVKLNKMGGLPQVFEYKWDINTFSKCVEAIDLYWKERKSDSNIFPD